MPPGIGGQYLYFHKWHFLPFLCKLRFALDVKKQVYLYKKEKNKYKTKIKDIGNMQNKSPKMIFEHQVIIIYWFLINITSMYLKRKLKPMWLKIFENYWIFQEGKMIREAMWQSTGSYGDETWIWFHEPYNMQNNEPKKTW